MWTGSLTWRTRTTCGGKSHSRSPPPMAREYLVHHSLCSTSDPSGSTLPVTVPRNSMKV